MSKDTDPLKIINKSDRLYCNITNKNSLSFTCFSKNDVFELISIYNSDIANINSKKNNKPNKINGNNELYPTINIRDSRDKEKSVKLVYDELKKNLSKYKKNNNKEYCWLKLSAFKKKFINSDNLFVPEMPTEWCSNITRWRESLIDAPWLSNYDIDNIVEQYEGKYSNFKFLGSTPIDFRQKKHNKCILNIFNDDSNKNKWLKNNNPNSDYCDYNPIGYKNKHCFGIVFNTDNHDGGGRHWMSLYINTKTKVILFFDSAVTYSHLHPEIKSFIKNIQKQYKNINFTFKYNNIQHQQSNSECGMYSIYFILTMLDADESEKFNSLDIFDTYFNSSEKTVSDKLMVLYRTKIFRSECDC
tara:strand:- start:2384 stop:3457 length:1074 start_codon:yes stop_codon:yes gene_type:complete